MKKMNRLLCLLLATLMALPLIAGCADNTDSETPETPDTAVTESDSHSGEVVETQTDATLDALPDDLNFGGDEIVLISRDREGWTTSELAAESINSDPVNDATFERNRMVESRLNVKLKNILIDGDYDAVVKKVAMNVTSGLHEYDIMAAPCNASINESLNKTFIDLRSTRYMDLEEIWWSQGFNEAVEYHGSQFVATGSAVLAMYRFAFVTIFNKALFDGINLPYLYEDVRAQTWTLDRQIELVTLLHDDNGNGVQDETGDVYGFVTGNHISVDPYWSSCNVNIIGKNQDGDYEVIFDTGRLHDVTDKLMKLYYGSGHAVYNCAHIPGDLEQEQIRDLFASGFSAMATVRLMELEAGTVRNMSDEFGVVPMPKYDTNQTEYRTLLHNQFTVMAIPSTVAPGRIDEISAVMEALSSEGYRIMRPAYYEDTLRTKLLSDPDSAEMMELVVNNIYIDAGILYTTSFDSFHDRFRTIMKTQNNTVSSDYAGPLTKLTRRALPALETKLDKLVAASGN